MRRCIRGTAPSELAENADAWTADWIRRRREDPSARFNWPRRVNLVLLPELLAMTADHCAYCDGWPLDATGQPTIDHFRPKHRFEDLAFAWRNLFPSCDRCQGVHGKGSGWDDALLAPDDVEYTFERYFLYVPGTGEMEPNPRATPADQERARVTIDLFRLNGGGRPQDRMRVARLYGAFEERPYRFVFEPT